ncbi:sulfate ABC transporter permease subunit CysT [Paenibacillus thermotolerans]|uniref:sulfate ABC transporter permease subunit CysT n=1 Tax=Paenibacillus thermotolerans TaxID=3027807 RepID=UPI003CC6336B
MNNKSTKRVIPGYKLSLGFTLFYLCLIVLIPLAGVFIKSAGLSAEQFWAAATHPRVLASYRISFGTALAAALINSVFGLLLAWVIVRYRFPGRKIVDAMVDLPFALPTAVAGIALTSIYAKNGWIGSIVEPFGFKIAFTPLGITLALMFVGLPFIVRTVQPILQDLEKEMEEASATLGAGSWTTFRKVIFPELLPGLITGFALALARGIGEYGSVVFIAGNMPMKTEIAPLLIITKLEQYQFAEATAIASVMLVVSFLMLFLINWLQWRVAKR